MNNPFLKQLFEQHQNKRVCVPSGKVVDWFDELLGLLYPELSSQSYASEEAFLEHLKALEMNLKEFHKCISEKELQFTTEDLLDAFSTVQKELNLDREALLMGDPAAKNIRMVTIAYPGFYAIAAYRISHQLYKMGVELIPRIISEHAHTKTGVDIHPAATIGKSFCIDHGTGVVIGETTEIGNHVKLYQGVTLGALSVDKKDAKSKRHPTIEDNVVIYAGATILGGKTVVGKGSIVGGNVWLTRSVPPETKVYYSASMTDEKGEVDKIIMKP